MLHRGGTAAWPCFPGAMPGPERSIGKPACASRHISLPERSAGVAGHRRRHGPCSTGRRGKGLVANLKDRVCEGAERSVPGRNRSKETDRGSMARDYGARDTLRCECAACGWHPHRGCRAPGADARGCPSVPGAGRRDVVVSFDGLAGHHIFIVGPGAQVNHPAALGAEWPPAVFRGKQGRPLAGGAVDGDAARGGRSVGGFHQRLHRLSSKSTLPS